MSAYKKLDCQVVDRSILLMALGELGLNYTEHQEPQNLRGFTGDLREQKANIIVEKSVLNKSFTGASNDLGFLWNDKDKQYDMIVSDYDVSSGIPNRVKQAYAKVAIEQALAGARFNVEKSNTNLKQRAKQKVNIVAKKII